MIIRSSPYNDVLFPKDSNDTRDTIDNKELNVDSRSFIDKDSSPKRRK